MSFDDLLRRVSALFDEHRASPAHPELVTLCNRIINQNNWLAARQLDMEKQMSALTDKIDALIAQRDAEKANAANADALSAQVAAVTAERDALQADVNDALARLANAGV